MRRIGAEFTITAYPALLRGADRVLLPGVGDVRRENPQTAGVSLLAVETQQLHADADAQYGLRQVPM